VDAIWSKYASEDLTFYSGDAGTWRGRVTGEQFVFTNLTNSFGNATAIISRRPDTQEAFEGKGVLAEDVQKIAGQSLDLVVQAQFCAALNRHAIDLTAASGATQDWSDTSRYFKTAPANDYVKFWHDADISYNRFSYGFCYDDVFDQSSTIHSSSPERAEITIGGFYEAVKAADNVSYARVLEAPIRITRSVGEHGFHLSTERFSGRDFTLYSMNGSMLHTGRIAGSHIVFDRGIPQGIYLYRIGSEGTGVSGKVRM